MSPAVHLAALESQVRAVPGTVSIWCGPVTGAARYVRQAATPHYAASMMKLAVMVAAYRAAGAGRLDLDAEVLVHNRFRSVLPGAANFALAAREDSDEAVWDQLDSAASLRWLIRRMIVRSSNLATNLVLAQVGVPAADEVWRLIGAGASSVHRGIEDAAARQAGITNEVSAADLARLLAALVRGAAAGPDWSGSGGELADPAVCREMLDILSAQEHNDDIAAGLPPGTRVAHKNGWVHGVRHGAGVVFPPDCPPYLTVVCVTSPLANGHTGRDDPACRLLADIAAASWADRGELSGIH
jgi:beta-lactamase class A